MKSFLEVDRRETKSSVGIVLYVIQGSKKIRIALPTNVTCDISNVLLRKLPEDVTVDMAI